jgi:hypothetical protein
MGRTFNVLHNILAATSSRRGSSVGVVALPKTWDYTGQAHGITPTNATQIGSDWATSNLLADRQDGYAEVNPLVSVVVKRSAANNSTIVHDLGTSMGTLGLTDGFRAECLGFAKGGDNGRLGIMFSEAADTWTNLWAEGQMARLMFRNEGTELNQATLRTAGVTQYDDTGSAGNRNGERWCSFRMSYTRSTKTAYMRIIEARNPAAYGTEVSIVNAGDWDHRTMRYLSYAFATTIPNAMGRMWIGGLGENWPPLF